GRGPLVGRVGTAGGPSKFGEASSELLSDFLINLNKRNKDNIKSLEKCSGTFKEKKLMEHVFLITKDMRLDPLAGYHAVELLQRFMVKRLTDLFTTPTPQGAAADPPRSYEAAVFDKLKEKFPLIIFSCVQLASKMSLHSHMIDTSAAVRFLHSVGLSVSKKAVLDSELMVLKGLEFRLNAPNPLTYVEILLEVLGHNESSTPVDRLYPLCHHVLQFVSLQRTAIYESLLGTTVQWESPTTEHRYVSIKVTISIFFETGGHSSKLRISPKSIRDFAGVTLMHIVGASCPVTFT
uniref:Cyclin N-terminal domain containing 1 n=1 Tax=Labrus bergylta TaxID=56723 RepID=A0A3Q3H0X0_9LABR